jgi:hypothetical protein
MSPNPSGGVTMLAGMMTHAAGESERLGVGPGTDTKGVVLNTGVDWSKYLEQMMIPLKMETYQS